jgi:glycogen phosphorylase/synthase
MNKETLQYIPDYLFETSWEVCNKVGGIYTVVSTKALTLVNEFRDNYILIGPDVWKETHQNPEFTEDKFLYRSWRDKAEGEGLKIKIGRWNIAGNPVVVLVDFTPFFSEKDKIFGYLWETYKLDSLSGGWDYIEPALFGYAAGKIIESFYEFHLSHSDKLIAQFHEWMTGAGALYLKDKVPQIGTVFTTHATVVGRCIAGNGLPLYNDMESYDSDGIARQFGVVSKHSLEKLAAIESDAFTTVSEITNNECRQFLDKEVTVVTPNGFEDTFVPVKEEFHKKRQEARDRIFEVTEGLLNTDLSRDSILILNSGRYEFRNKGIDLYIDALGSLNKQASHESSFVAFLMIPAYQLGPRKEVLERMGTRDFQHPVTNEYLTHNLHEAENDAIIRRIKANGLNNTPDDRVKIVFVPAYLNGTDGVFNMGYYDLLIGFDGTIFPSYYEPWGYTPLESLAFHIPTITTSLAGFGLWVKSLYPTLKDCITVIPRSDDNDSMVVEQMVKSILSCSSKSEKEIVKVRIKAWEISRSALWTNLVDQYLEAYSHALDKVAARSELFKDKQPENLLVSLKPSIEVRPDWKKVLVQPQIPKNLEVLNSIAKNLWWCWHYEGSELFEMIDKERWYELKFNPIALIESLSYQEMKALSKNKAFLEKLESVNNSLTKYMAEAENKRKGSVAYFSMEFGLHDTIKIYSGGLGMLAGDYLKEASDSNVNIIGVGLLYRYGYFQQRISISGDQLAIYTPQKFTHLPIQPVRDAENNWLTIDFALPGRTMYAKVWKVDVGRIPLYLLDTDIEENIEIDRVITHQLYGGDSENRLRQEILLGIGGIRMISKLGIKPDIYHCNEGHAAFIGIERLRDLITDHHLTFAQAVEVVRSSSLFTTHTPVPAGHDTFSEDLIRQYLAHYADRLNIKWDDFMHLGKVNDNDPNEKFSMSILATTLSQEVNGVSKIHGRVTREMMRELYPAYYPEELHIGYVTNGVHLPTWAAHSWLKLYEEKFGPDFLRNQSDPALWEKIHEVDDKVIWDIRLKQKRQLTDYLALRFYTDMTRRNENPKLLFKIRETYRPEALTIGFARRFATYKRAHMLFSNLERLSKIVNHPTMPVQFVFAGKAHPNDKAGQDLIKRIYEISKTKEFLGKILFIENYDIEVAKYLIRGVDVWLNTPTRPMEASGTSGEKAVMNGVVNFSVLDGWWAEGYRKDAGWALSENPTYEDHQFQDELDAETLYSVLEEEIVPIFYEREGKNLPVKWIGYIKNTIAGIAPHFTMKRQLDDYYEKYYNTLFERSAAMHSDDFAFARKYAAWKKHVNNGWDNIEVLTVNIPDSTRKPLMVGESFKAEIVLDTHELSGQDIGIEVVFGKKVNDEVREPVLVEEMKMVKQRETLVTFTCDIQFERPGVFDFAFRLFPKNPMVPHRQDFYLARWI